MSLTELLLLLIVIGGAFYAGFLFGRQSAPTNGRTTSTRADGDPLPGPSETLEPPRRSSAPPPASAGGEPPSYGSTTGSGAPRRTATPPPARAGLMDTGSGKSPKKD